MLRNERTAALKHSLQQSLQEALSEVSGDCAGLNLTPPAPAPAPASGGSNTNEQTAAATATAAAAAAAATATKLRLLQGLSHSAADRTTQEQLGLLSQQQQLAAGTTMSSWTQAALAASGLRAAPSSAAAAAALGMTSNDILIAAAAEKRILDQARAVAMEQALAKQTLMKQQLYNHSLLSMIQGGMMGGGGGGGAAGFLPQSAAMSKSVQMAAAAAAAANASHALHGSKETLEGLGNSLRKKNTPYLDVSKLSDPSPAETSSRRTRGGVTEPFPDKLHRMLTEVAEAGDDDIISFFSHGRAFSVHNNDRFVKEIMPKYFKQSRLSSFQRQLNLYGFTRITSGPDSGGYYHELFLKGRPALCMHMRRVGVPSKGGDRRRQREKNISTEPDFYSMNSLPANSTLSIS